MAFLQFRRENPLFSERDLNRPGGLNAPLPLDQTRTFNPEATDKILGKEEENEKSAKRIWKEEENGTKHLW